jgi:cellulose synthase/poly-beta-1,6-N-acetylglucosamine synthase-like glycosyltransferase
LFLFLLLSLSFLILVGYTAQFVAAIAAIGQLKPTPDDATCVSSLTSVIVPAYNEADNIQDCIKSILASTKRSQQELEVWVVDDQSTDATWAILTTLQQQLQDPRLHLLSGAPRPEAEVWIGKNWACTQAIAHTKGEFLLFIDADVRLKPGAIAAAVKLVQQEQIGLLNCIPEVVCGSLIEWLVQPLIFINLVISFAQPAVRDPNQAIAYAAGPFMLFRRDAYEQIGEHRAVAQFVAEDVALARAIKQHQFKLQYRLGTELASLRMYTSWSTLWEGWTKVLYVGAWRSVGLMILLAVLMFGLYTVPLLGLLYLRDLKLVALILASFGVQYYLRSRLAKALGCAPKYWWLQGIGGLIVGVLAIVSVIKTETGWGWTWRGRPLT